MAAHSSVDEVETIVNFMGFDFIATVEFVVTDRGAPPMRAAFNYGGDPGWAPEWDVLSIELREDRTGEYGPAFKTHGALFRSLCECEEIVECVSGSIRGDTLAIYWRGVDDLCQWIKSSREAAI